MGSTDVKSTGIAVLGMHRSGTSATAGVLALLGVQLGSRLDPPHAYDNPKGYFENSRIVGINRRLLELLSSRWDDILTRTDAWEKSPLVTNLVEEAVSLLRADFGAAPLWAIKDPRICRLLPFWQRVFSAVETQPRYLLVIRHPMEVAASLARRDRHSRAKALRLWLLHCLESERRTRDACRSFLSYEELLAEPRKEMTRVAEELGLDWPESRWPEIADFLCPTLRRHVVRTPIPHALTARSYELLKSTGSGLDLSAMDRCWNDFLEDETSVREEFRDHLRQITGELHEAGHQLNRIEQSLSWRLAAPLRALRGRFGGGKRPPS